MSDQSSKDGRKIVPLGGKHRSARSLLAEIMNDEDVETVVVYAFSKDGLLKCAQFGMTVRNMAWAAVDLMHWSQEKADDTDTAGNPA